MSLSMGSRTPSSAIVLGLVLGLGDVQALGDVVLSAVVFIVPCGVSYYSRRPIR